MYSDPAKIRSHVVKLRLSDEEHRLVQALVDYTGEQKASLLREMLLDQAVSILYPQRSAVTQANEGQYQSVIGY